MRIGRTLLFAILLEGAMLPVAQAGEDEAWAAVIALDRAPAAEFKSREEARRITLEYLDRQEAAVQNFQELYPKSTKAVDAQFRLARIHLVRGDFSDDPKMVESAFTILGKLRADPLLPPERVADVAFAKISLSMLTAQKDLRGSRNGLVEAAQKFREEFPGDHRLAALFAELSGVYQDLPKRQKELLEIARPLAKQKNLRLEIADDLRRIDLLGKPLDLQFEAIDRRRIDLKNYRGKIVALCFFADISPPSLIALARVEELSRSIPSHSLQCLGVSLDHPTSARETMGKLGIEWPVGCDGLGWESPMLRRLGINALPTVWIIDRRGILRELAASEDPEAAVRGLMRER